MALKLFAMLPCLTFQNNTATEVLMQQKKIWITLLAIAMVALCGLMVLVTFFSFRSITMPDLRSWNFSIGIPASTARSDEVKTFSVTTPAALEVINPNGDVSIKGTKTGEIKISMHKVSHGLGQETADENLKKLSVSITQDGNKVRVVVPEPENAVMNPAYVDLTIEVPADTTVNAEVTNSDLDAANLENDAMLHSNFGSVEISGLKNGSLKASSENGSVSARRVMSGEKTIEMSSDFGSINLYDAQAGSFTIISKNGEITLGKLESGGMVSVKDEFGQIDLANSRAKSMEISSRNGGIDLSSIRVEGPLAIHNDFGGITLDNTFAVSYDLKNKNGGITLEKASGAITASTDFGRIDISEGQACDLNLTTQNGSIDYEGSLGQGPHTLSSDFGRIFLSLPSDTAMTVDLETEFGGINNDFETLTDGSIKNHQLSGKINGGGAALNIRAKNGGITLESSGN
jgi:DUF4097 and DUF4098 domain-containing protein YvlB